MDVERCICCGEIISEGRQVCWACEHKVMEDKDDIRVFERTEDKISKED